jgi:hypothetical protein
LPTLFLEVWQHFLSHQHFSEVLPTFFRSVANIFHQHFSEVLPIFLGVLPIFFLVNIFRMCCNIFFSSTFFGSVFQNVTNIF